MMTDSKKLLAALQKEAERWSLEDLYARKNTFKAREYPVESTEYLNQANNIYNIDVMIMLKEDSGNFFPENIPSPYYNKFVAAMDEYMDKNAPGNTELKDYIKILELYKTYIAKLPLHPEGLQLPGGGKIYKSGKNYFCTAKQKHIHDENSLCRFCTAKMCEY